MSSVTWYLEPTWNFWPGLKPGNILHKTFRDHYSQIVPELQLYSETCNLTVMIMTCMPSWMRIKVPFCLFILNVCVCVREREREILWPFNTLFWLCFKLECASYCKLFHIVYIMCCAIFINYSFSPANWMKLSLSFSIG